MTYEMLALALLIIVGVLWEKKWRLFAEVFPKPQLPRPKLAAGFSRCVQAGNSGVSYRFLYRFPAQRVREIKTATG